MIFRGENNPITIPEVVHNYEKISDIPDVIIHYDASGLVVNTDNSYGTVDSAGNILTWKNQANTNHATQISAANQPTLLESNNIKSVHLNGSQFFNITNVFNVYVGALIFVLKPTTTIIPGSTPTFLLSTYTGTSPYMSLIGFGEISSAGFNETIVVTGWSNPWNNYRFKGTYTKSLGSVNNLSNANISKLVIKANQGIEFVINDEQISPYGYVPGNTGYIRVLPWLSQDNSDYYWCSNIGKLFATYDSVGCFNGDVYEVIIMNRPIKSYEMNYINYILSQKYGI